VNLRNLVFHTRHALNAGLDLLDDFGERLALAPGICESDVAAFLTLAAQTEKAEAAIDLYTGKLLARFELPGNESFEEWLSSQRNSVHRVYLKAVRAAYDRARLAGDRDEAIVLAQRWVRDEPYSERGRRALMRSLVRVGDRAGAVAAYREWTQVVARDLDTVPDPATVALAERIGPHGEPARPLPTRAPLFYPAFIGRCQDLAWLDRESKESTPRLLLVCGERGSGRTRLLAEYIRRLRARGQEPLFGRTPPAAALPFQSLVDALRSWFGQGSNEHWEVLGQIAAVDLAELARLVPEVRRHCPALPEPLPGWPPEVDRRLVQALAATFDAIASLNARNEQQFILCVDDLDESTQPALDALAALLVRSRKQVPILVVATVGKSQSASLQRWLRDAARLVSIGERRLEPLSEQETEHQLRSMAGPAPQPVLDSLASLIHEHSGGVPLRTVEIAHRLFDKGTLQIGPDGRWRLMQPVLGVPLS